MGTRVTNRCPVHKDFQGELCPVCLMNERDAALARVAELEIAVRGLLDARAEWQIDGDLYVPGICEYCWQNDEEGHAPDCPRQKAAALVQPEAERAAVPEATVCPGDYCDDGCDRCPGM